MYRDFFIIAAGWNCRDYVKKCIRSVNDQDYPGKVTAVFVSDGSTDNTGFAVKNEANNFKDPQHTLVGYHYKYNEGAAYRRHQAIMQYKPSPDTIILFLGLDDELLPGALRRINQEYMRGKWMTYGNWVNQKGKGLPDDFDLHFDLNTHEEREYRKVTYRSTAPNTFLAKLYYKIPEDDLKIDGQWIKTCTEAEVMYSCLEMCGASRIGVIETPIYLYNEKRVNGSLNRYGGKTKKAILSVIASREKRPLFLEP